MPRKPTAKRLPAYRRHRPSGRAVVTLTDAGSGRRQDFYLGPYGSAESKAQYDRIVRDWLAGGRVVEASAKQARAAAPADHPDPRTMTVTDLARAWWKHLRQRHPGPLTGHLFNLRSTLRLLRSAAGGLPAREFGPRALRRIVRLMVERKGWKRRSVNKGIQFIRAMYRWAVAEQLMAVEVWQALTAVAGLRRGEQGVEDGEKVEAVPLAHVEAIRPHLSPQVEAIVDLMLLTGARCGEVVGLRLADLNTTGKLWTAAPAKHKGTWRGKGRTIYIGPRGQAVLGKFMAGRAVDAPLFSPREAVQWHAAQEAHCRRRENQKPNPRKTERTVGERYETKGIAKAIERACDKAGVSRWSPHQLRHAAAGIVRREAGLEAAAVVLGHSSAVLTDQTYAERDASLAEAVLLKIG